MDAEILRKREEKRARAAALNAEFFAAQKAKLEEHLRIAKEAAEGKKAKVTGAGEVRKAAPAEVTAKPVETAVKQAVAELTSQNKE